VLDDKNVQPVFGFRHLPQALARKSSNTEM
jgi:hypothetical protein